MRQIKLTNFFRFNSQIIDIPNKKDDLLIKSSTPAKIVTIFQLLQYRKKGYSLGAEIIRRRNWKTQLWYVRAIPNPTRINKKREKNIYLGRIERILLKIFYPENIIEEMEFLRNKGYFPLNFLLDEMLNKMEEK